LISQLKDPSLLRQQACLIAGAWLAADNATTVAVTDPANGEQIGTVPMCGAETVRAIAAAEVAQRQWRNVSGKRARSQVLRRLADLMLAAPGRPGADHDH
jgi:succinate-semialdehyde dehydrogenase/glutarate-semialdehyde dehydrogenase